MQARILDSRYLEFCNTENQKRLLTCYLECGCSGRKVAEKYKCNRRYVDKVINNIIRRAQIKGLSPQHDANHPVMPGELLRGRSTLYNAEGKPIQTWVKTKADDEAIAEAVIEWIERLAEDVNPLPPIKPPKEQAKDLLAVIPMGDPHFGMYAWAEEAGADFDLSTANTLTRSAIDKLVSMSPAAEECLLINLGDFFHADNTTNRTPASGHALDVDTRFDKILQVAEDCMVYCLRRLLEKYKTVRFWSLAGNHDPHCGSPLARILRAYFRDNPRIQIEVRPGKFSYMQWGGCQIGATHGDTVKMQDLPLIMAHDRPKEWGDTWFRVWYVGHVHHKRVQEYPGCTIEYCRTLVPRDAWHQAQGYRALRDMQLIILDKSAGEIARFRWGVQ